MKMIRVLVMGAAPVWSSLRPGELKREQVHTIPFETSDVVVFKKFAEAVESGWVESADAFFDRQLFHRINKCSYLADNYSDEDMNRDSICAVMGDKETIVGLLLKSARLPTGGMVLSTIGEAMVASKGLKKRIECMFDKDSLRELQYAAVHGTSKYASYVLFSVMSRVLQGTDEDEFIRGVFSDLVSESTLVSLLPSDKVVAYGENSLSDKRAMVRRSILSDLNYFMRETPLDHPDESILGMWMEMRDAVSRLLSNRVLTDEAREKLFWLAPVVNSYLVSGPRGEAQYCSFFLEWHGMLTQVGVKPSEVWSDWRLELVPIHHEWIPDILRGACPVEFGSLQMRLDYIKSSMLASKSIQENTVLISLSRDPVGALIDDSIAALGPYRLTTVGVMVDFGESLESKQDDDFSAENALMNLVEWVTRVLDQLVAHVLVEVPGAHPKVSLLVKDVSEAVLPKLNLLGTVLGTALINNIPVVHDLPSDVYAAMTGGGWLHYRGGMEGKLRVSAAITEGMQMVVPNSFLKLLRVGELWPRMTAHESENFAAVLSFASQDVLVSLVNKRGISAESLVSVATELSRRRMAPDWVALFPKTAMKKMGSLGSPASSYLKQRLVFECQRFSNEDVYIEIMTDASGGIYEFASGSDHKISESRWALFMELLDEYRTECDPLEEVRAKSFTMVGLAIESLFDDQRNPRTIYSNTRPVDVVRRNLLIELSAYIVRLREQNPFVPERSFWLLGAIVRAWSTARTLIEGGTITMQDSFAIEAVVISYIAMLGAGEDEPSNMIAFCENVNEPAWRNIISFYELHSENLEERQALAPWSIYTVGIQFWRNDARRILHDVCEPILNSPQHRIAKLLRQLPAQVVGQMTVDRENVLNDSFNQQQLINNQTRLRIVFTDGIGDDMGGLLREWYSLMSDAISSELLQLVPESQNLYRFNSEETRADMLRFAGSFVARSIIDEQPLGLRLSNGILRQLFGEPVVLADLQFEEDELYRSYKGILDNDGDTIDLLCLTFASSIENADGTISQVDLIEGGATVEVTATNVDEYVNALVQYRLVTRFEEQMNSFVQGFHEVIPMALIKDTMTVDIVQRLVTGSVDIQSSDVIDHMRYQHGYTSVSPQVVWLHETLREYNQQELLMFIAFVIGTDKLPMGGIRNLKPSSYGTPYINVSKFSLTNNARPLPSTKTCFYTLNLPEYNSKGDLAFALRIAIEYGHKGFGLV